MSSARVRPFCLGLNALIRVHVYTRNNLVQVMHRGAALLQVDLIYMLVLLTLIVFVMSPRNVDKSQSQWNKSP